MSTLNVTRITVVLRDNTDTVYLGTDAPTPFPELDAAEPGRYPASVQIDVRHGYGPAWVLRTFKRSADEIIDGRSQVPDRRLARIDADGTAKPKTRLLAHARAGDCVGPGSLHADSLEDTETGERTPL